MASAGTRRRNGPEVEPRRTPPIVEGMGPEPGTGRQEGHLLRPKPTAGELRQGANNLLYEVQMVSNAAALFDDEDRWNDGHGWQSKTLCMANLESFLVHM